MAALLPSDDQDEGIEEKGPDDDPKEDCCGDSLDEEDSSSGFCSNSVGVASNFDNMSSYESIGAGGQVDVGSLNGLILDSGGGLMLEEDDFGDNVEDEEDIVFPVERLLKRSESINSKTR